MTPTDLCTNALKELGIVAAGETPRSEDLNDAFTRVNRLIDAWAVERGTIQGVVRNTYALISGKGSPTNPLIIGPTGDFVQVRPEWIQGATILISPGTTTQAEQILDIIGVDEYRYVAAKFVQSSIPMKLYYEGVSTGKLFLWPVPNDTTKSITLDTPIPISQFTSLSQTITLYPGYQLALELNLAVDCVPMFGAAVDGSMLPMLIKRAGEAKRFIKSANFDAGIQRSDLGILSGMSQDGGNWLTGP